MVLSNSKVSHSFQSPKFNASLSTGWYMILLSSELLVSHIELYIYNLYDDFFPPFCTIVSTIFLLFTCMHMLPF